MTKPLMISAILAITCLPCASAVELSYYVPQDVQYDPAVTSPNEYLGFEIGERHLQYDQLNGYLRKIGKQSKRATLQEYARSYGQRPLMMLTITSEENHKQIKSIQAAHRQLADPQRSAKVETESLPAVIWMGYNVHGNEASAANAAPLVAYHLLAAKGQEIERLLRDTVILLDPCLNPDGLDRFAHWVNNHKGRIANPDPQHREHQEPFPSGRTNYYWFDLNRDWLPAQHPESQGRLAVYHRWLPNVVLDFHEMGSDATYFFQPGILARTHPLTPQRNVDLTRRFAQYHARALDGVRSLYFTEERFDDFYMGKGSTYPDLHGGVGILFEQGSARGHVQETQNGLLTFPFAIRNQFLTSLSSLAATQDTRKELLEFKREFYRDAISLARNSKIQGFVFSANGDAARADQFVEILARHSVRVHHLAKDLLAEGISFKSEESYIIPAEQPEFRFLTSLFETRTTFAENIFYDISTWTLPLAFNLDIAEISEPLNAELLGADATSVKRDDLKFEAGEDDYAYLLDWRDYFAPRALYRLLAADIKVKTAQQPFQTQDNGDNRQFGFGTLLVPLGTQMDKQAEIHQLLKEIAQQDRVDITAVPTGLTPQGADLGSSDFASLKKPAVLLVVGEGVDSYEAGEVWHLLDERFNIPVTLVDNHRLGSVDLGQYTTLIVVSGTYRLVSESAIERIRDWLGKGGTLIAIGDAVKWVNSSKIAAIKVISRDNPSDTVPPQQATPVPSVQRRPYANARDDAAFQLIKGSIFRAHIDLTHPVCYGYERESLPVFRDQAFFLEPPANVYSTPAAYAAEPRISGYVSEENLKLAPATASVLVKGGGAGRLIVLVDNPNFRGFWYGTNRLFLNSVFFGPIIREPSASDGALDH